MHVVQECQRFQFHKNNPFNDKIGPSGANGFGHIPVVDVLFNLTRKCQSRPAHFAGERSLVDHLLEAIA